MSLSERKTESTSGGCELPEALRRYYLDTMGIQVWDDVNTEAQTEVAVDPVVWQALQQTVAACTSCDLHQSRTQTVFGVGNQQADLLVIGEAPGRDEDEQGEPLLGV